MKNFFKTIAIASLFLPSLALATTAIPWITTDNTSIKPNTINGVNPAVKLLSQLYASSTALINGTTTIGNSLSNLSLGFFNVLGSNVPTLYPTSTLGALGILNGNWYIKEDKATNLEPALSFISDDLTSSAGFNFSTSTGSLTIGAPGVVGIGASQIYLGGSATTTSPVGIDILDGCYAISGVCVGGNANDHWATSTLDSTAIIPSGATKVGIGTTSPFGLLGIGGDGVNNSVIIGSSTSSRPPFIVNKQGFVGFGEPNPLRQVVIRDDRTAAITVLGLDNENTTDGNATVISGRSSTTNGGTAFTEYSGIRMQYDNHDATALCGSIRFFVKKIATLNFALSMACDGQTGFGTQSPTFQVDVASTSPRLGLTDTNAGTNLKKWFFENLDGVLGFGTSTDAGTPTDTYRPLKIGTDSGVTLASLSGSGTRCVQTDSNGLLSPTASSCSGSGSTTTPDYVVYNQGNTTKALRTIDNSVISSGSADTVLNAIVADSPTGASIGIRSGTYYLNATTTFAGSNSGDISAPIWNIYGAGQNTTKFVVNNDTDGFFFKDSVKTNLNGMTFYLKGASNAIMASSTSGFRSLWNSNFQNIAIFGTTSNSTGFGFNLVNDDHNNFSNIYFNNIGSCLKSSTDNNNLFNPGDTTFSNLWCSFSTPSGSGVTTNTYTSGVAYEFNGSLTSTLVNQNTLINTGGYDPKGTRTYLRLNHAKNIRFIGGEFEGFATGTEAYNSSQLNTLDFEYTIATSTTNAYHYFDSTSKNNTIGCTYVDSYAGTQPFFIDNNTTQTQPNVLKGVNGGTCTLNGSGTFTYSTTSASLIRDVQGGSYGSLFNRIKQAGDKLYFDFDTNAQQIIRAVGTTLEFFNGASPANPAIAITNSSVTGFKTASPQGTGIEVNGTAVFDFNNWITQSSGGMWIDPYNIFLHGIHRANQNNAWLGLRVGTNDILTLGTTTGTGVGAATTTGQFNIMGDNNALLDLFTIGTTTGNATTTALRVDSSGNLIAGINGSTVTISSLGGAGTTAVCTTNTGLLTNSGCAGATGLTWSINSNGNLAPTTTIPVYLPTYLYSSSTALFDGLGTWKNGLAVTGATSTFDGVKINNNFGLQFVGYSALPQVFAGDPTTGMHFDGPGILSFHNGGVQTMLLNALNNVGIGKVPSTKLDVSGTASSTDLQVNGNSTTTRLAITGTPSALLTTDSLGIVQGTTSLSLVYGGTGTSTFSNGGVVFSDSTKLTQDTTNFFWDNTNKRLGIGTNAPGFPIEVKATGAGTIMIDSGSGSNNSLVRFRNGGTSKWAMGNLGSDSSFRLNTGTNIGTSDILTVTSGGLVGISSTTPFAKLGLKGDGTGTGLNFLTTGSGNAVGLTVLDNGKVGIGTTTPTRYLEVAVSGNRGELLLMDQASGFVDSTTQGGTYLASQKGIFSIQGMNSQGSGAAHVADFDQVNNFVGFNTTTPATRLDVYDNNSYPGRQITVESTGEPGIQFTNYNANGKNYRIFSGGGGSSSYNNKFVFYDVPNGTDRMVIDTNGLTGISTSSPWRTLSVTGTVGFDGLTSTSTPGNSLCLSSSKEVTVRTNNSCNAASSIRYKTDINSLTSGLDEVLKLRPVTYKYKDSYLGANTEDPNWSRLQEGFIAEEVQKIDPLLVTTDKQGLPDGVQYDKMSALLTKAIQELNAKIDAKEPNAQKGNFNPINYIGLLGLFGLLGLRKRK